MIAWIPAYHIRGYLCVQVPRYSTACQEPEDGCGQYLPGSRSMKNYRILYEDTDVLVLHKPAGLAVQSARASVPDLVSQVRNGWIEQGRKDPYLGLVNRLDQPVEGILLIGKNAGAAAKLSRQLGGQMEKYYLALVHGKLLQEAGTLVDYLIHDHRTNCSCAGGKDEPGAKRSELRYRVLEEWEDRSLLEIHLLTGRHHQIRVQLANAGVPIVGDVKYGASECGTTLYRTKGRGQLCLCAFKVKFIHPRTGKAMSFQVEPTFRIPPKAL